MQEGASNTVKTNRDYAELCSPSGFCELLLTPMVKKRLASVVTRLWLKSDCDRDLVATAAAKLVEEKKFEILKFLQPLP